MTSASSLVKGIIRGSGVYSIAILAQRLMSVLLLPINTRFLTPADFGVLELIEQITVVVSTLLGNGFATSMGFFFFETEAPSARRRVIGTTVVGSLLLGLVGGTAGFFLSGFLGRLAFARNGYERYLQVAMLAMPFLFLLEAGFSALRVLNRPALFAGVAVLRTLLIVAGTVCFVALLRWRIWGVLTTTVGSIVVIALILFAYCLREARSGLDLRLFFRMWRFSVPIGLGAMALFIVHFGDRFILPHYRSLAELGIYGLAYKIAMVLALVQASFQSYWNAQIFEIMKRKDAPVIFGRVFTYAALVYSACGLALIVFSRPALRIGTTPAFYSAASLVPILVFAYFTRAVGDFFRGLFLVESRPSYDAACNWVGGIICLAGYFSLIPVAGALGAAIATALAFLAVGVISVIWTRRLRDYHLEQARLLKMGLVITPLLTAYFLIPVAGLIPQLAWAAGLTVAYPVLLWATRFLTPGEQRHLVDILQRYLPANRP